MKVNSKQHRSAIAMIELIFAIVVIGITLMSAPTLIAQATNSATVTYKQESIAILAAHANHMLTYAWDERNRHNNLNNILDVTNGDSDLNRNVYYRGDSVSADRRRFNSNNLFATVALGSDNGETEDNDIDDLIDDNTTLVTISGSTNNSQDGEYVDKTMKIVTNVIYSRDTANYTNPDHFEINNIIGKALAGGGSSNIKYTTVTISSQSGAEELSDSITLHAFMCNIGGANIESEPF